MISFFRKIRKQHLSEHRLAKYLFYALGEITLVVIGILIALYINDRYADSRDRQKERAYLQRFDRELEINLAEMDRLVFQSDSVVVRIDSMIAFKLAETQPASNETFNRLALAAVDYLIFQSAEATVRDLIGSGELDLIQDESIREAIATWDAELTAIRSLEGDHKRTFNDLLEYFKQHTDIYMIMRGRRFIDEEAQERLTADPVFFNALTFHAIPLQMLHSEYDRKRKEFHTLKERVEDEVERLRD